MHTRFDDEDEDIADAEETPGVIYVLVVFLVFIVYTTFSSLPQIRFSLIAIFFVIFITYYQIYILSIGCTSALNVQILGLTLLHRGCGRAILFQRPLLQHGTHDARTHGRHLVLPG